MRIGSYGMRPIFASIWKLLGTTRWLAREGGLISAPGASPHCPFLLLGTSTPGAGFTNLARILRIPFAHAILGTLVYGGALKAFRRETIDAAESPEAVDLGELTGVGEGGV